MRCRAVDAAPDGPGRLLAFARIVAPPNVLVRDRRREP